MGLTLTKAETRSLFRLVRYNWEDERDDYQYDNPASQKIHIFRDLVALDNALTGTKRTPESHLNNVKGAKA